MTIRFTYGGVLILDYRLNTFIVLSKILNYTQAAKVLHITQPAVSQHIKYLEESYKCKLFNYENKRLSLSPAGKRLYEYAVAIQTSADKIKNELKDKENPHPSLRFGTTLTIGEYTMRDILKKTLLDHPKINLDMRVSNTKNLLQALQDGLIDFAILEGHFDKSKYAFYPFKNVDFIGISSKDHSFPNKTITFQDIIKETIILRENGSGTRNIFKKILYEQNFTLESIQHYLEIGNMKLIKDLVADDFGISFLYKESVIKELQENILKEIQIENFDITREFNFVYLKGSLHEDEYIKWFDYFIQKSI